MKGSSSQRDEVRQLEAHEQQYRAILDSALDAIVTMNAQGEIVEFNSAAERMFGYRREDVLGKQMAELIIPPAFREQHHRGLARYLAGGAPAIMGRHIEIRAMRHGGTEFPIELSITRVAESEPALFTGFIRDISRRKQAEAALEASRSQFESILHSIDGIVWEADARTFQFTFVSQQAERLLGYPLKQWLEPNFWRDHVHPDDFEQTANYCLEATRDRRPHKLEYRMIAADGRPVWLCDFVTVVSENGAATHLRGVMVDMTERKCSEDALARSENRLRAILESSPECVKLLDENCVLLEMNPAGLAMIEADSFEQVAGRNMCELVAPEHQPIVGELLRRVFAGEGGSSEFELIGLKGTRKWMDMRAVPLRNNAGRIIAALGVTLDVTQRRRADDILRRSEANLQTAQAQAKMGSWELDLGTMAVWWSPQMFRMFDRDPSLRAADITEFERLIHPEDRPKVLGLYARLAELTAAETVEFRSNPEAGPVRHFRGIAECIRDRQGQPLKAAGTVMDVTERKRAEEELQSREERYQRQRSALIALTAAQNLPAGDITAALRRITETDANTMQVERVSIWRYRAEPPSIECVELFETTPRRHSSGTILLASDYPAYFKALREQDVIAADDAHQDPNTSEFSGSYLRPLGITSMLDASIHMNGEVQGVLCYEHVGPPRQWTADEKTFAVAMANLVALTFERWERQRTEEALRASHERFEVVARATNDVVWDRDLATDRLWWNESFQKLLRCGPEEFDSGIKFWEERLHPEDRERIRDSLRKLIASHGHNWSGEYRLRRNDGSYAHILDRGYLIHDVYGKPIRMIGALTDITRLKEMEQAVQRSERHFRSIIENALDLIAIIGRDGVVRFHSPSSLPVLGYRVEDLVGRNVFEFIHPEDVSHVREALARCFMDVAERTTVTFRFRHADGSWHFLETAGQRLSGEDPPAIVANSRDMTERRKMEEQLFQSQKMEAIGQLAGGVAHDFNNILTVIQGHAALAQMDETLPAKLRESIEEIHCAAERAANLTRQLLTFSRRQTMQPRDLDLNEVVANTTKMLQRILGEDIRLQVNYSSQPLFTRADAGMMDQVLLNLAVNSRDAMPKGGRLVIETSLAEFDVLTATQTPDARPGSFVCLSVSDTGCGITREILPHIFEPFFTTKDIGKGTGLGLATVYGIMQQHNGWITVYSEVNRGTTIRVYLPRAGTAATKTEAEAVSLESLRGSETILLVEDEASLRNLVRTVLLRLGYRILEAGTGVTALEIWKHHHAGIDLLLTDLVMPDGITGIELAERLLKEDPHLKVIYTSGYSAEIAGKDFPLQEGVNFVSKPFHPRVVAQAVRQCLDEK